MSYDSDFLTAKCDIHELLIERLAAKCVKTAPDEKLNYGFVIGARIMKNRMSN